MKSRKKSLEKNPFFSKMIKYNENKKDLTIHLPQFADCLSFRLVHSCIVNKFMPLSENLESHFYEGLLRTMEYFCCFKLYSLIEPVIISKLEP